MALIAKGVDKDYDWSFFASHLTQGEIPVSNDSNTHRKALISEYIASLLKLKVGDKFIIYFIDKNSKLRPYPFNVSGTYATSLPEFDAQFVFLDLKHIQKVNFWEDDQISGFEVMIDNFDKLEKSTELTYQAAGSYFQKDGGRLKITNIQNQFPQII